VHLSILKLERKNNAKWI